MTATTPDINELLDKARFEAWLRDRNPSANVGMTGDPYVCPIATYLAAHGVQNPMVTADFADKAPAWVGHFATLVDQLKDSKGQVRDHVKVRAYQGWAILERIG